MKQRTKRKYKKYLEVIASEGVLAKEQIKNFISAGYFPQYKQRLFSQAARECDESSGPTEIGFGGARGPGKSHGIFAQMALDDCKRAYGLKCLYLRKVGKRAREQLDDLRKRTLRHVPHSYRRNEGVITFPQWGDSQILVGHFKNESDIDSYLGLEYDLIAVEETTSLTATKFQALRDSNRTSRTDWRPRIYNSTNPGGVGHAWYKKRFINPAKDDNEKETRFIFGTVDDNVFINKEYRSNLEKNTGWRLRAYRFGDWDIAAGQFFTTWRHDTHVIESFYPPLNWHFWLAMDYGFTHYTVVYLFAENDGAIYVVDEHAERKWLVPRHADAVRAMLDRWRVTEFRIKEFYAGADVFAKKGTDGASIADQWEKAGFELESANIDRINGAAEILNRLGDVDNNIQASLYIFENCHKLIECLPSMEHDPRRPEDVLKVDTDDDGNGGDDPYDAARYGIMARASDKFSRAYSYGY